jgi:hypothetical protein
MGRRVPFGDPQQFVVRRVPPRLRAQPPDVSAAITVLRWPMDEEPNVRYHAQLSQDPQFATVLSEQTLDMPQFSIPRPGPGTYFLRVRVLDSDGFEGAFGEAQSFEVPVPAPPAEAAPGPRSRRWLWLLPAAAIIAGVAILL